MKAPSSRSALEIHKDQLIFHCIEIIYDNLEGLFTRWCYELSQRIVLLDALALDEFKDSVAKFVAHYVWRRGRGRQITPELAFIY